MLFLKTQGLDHYRKQRALTELTTHFKRILAEHALSAWEDEKEWQIMMDRITRGEIDPRSAAKELVSEVLRYSGSKLLFPDS